MTKKKNKQLEEENESSSVTPEEVGSQPKTFYELVKPLENSNGFVSKEKLNEVSSLSGFSHRIRQKQEMVVESISESDLMGASLRDKATSAKALGEQATELEQGKPMGNIQVFYIKANG